MAITDDTTEEKQRDSSDTQGVSLAESTSTPSGDGAESETSEWNLNGCLQVTGAFFINLNTAGLLYTFGVYQTFYTLDLLSNSSASAISWIGSTQSFCMFFLSLFVGPFFDGGHLRLLLVLGSFCVVFGMFMTSLCNALWQCFMAQGLTVGLGMGILYVIPHGVVGVHFSKHQGLAMGIQSMGGGVGGIVYPIVFDKLHPAVGFGWATRILAIVILVTSLIPLLTLSYPKSQLVALQNRPADEKSSHRTPQERLTHWLSTIADKSALTNYPWHLGVLSLTLGFMAIYTILYYINLYAISVGAMPPSTRESSVAWSMLVIINLAGIFGRGTTVLADRIGPNAFLAIIMLLGGIECFALIAVKERASMIAWCVLYGVASGGSHAVAGAVVVSSCVDKERMGSHVGLSLCLASFGTLVAGPIAGAILGARGWVGVFGWCGGLMCAGSVCAAAAEGIRRGKLTSL